MIELRTGLPGACKTLSAVEALSLMLKRWEKHPEEARPVFVDGVKDLALPHAPVPVKTIQAGGRSIEVPDWDAMPDGSWVLIDEAQRMFPPRSTQGTAPDYVAWLNTHRHRGFDITLITQNPKLIDFSVRALIGKHLHFRRLLGWNRAVCYEWDGCSDSLAVKGATATTNYTYPKDAFKFYKSAEVHTKQNFRLPKWLLVPVAGLALGVYAVPHMFASLNHVQQGGTVGAAARAAASSPSSATAARVGVVPASPQSVASVPVGVASSPVASPVYLGCLSMGGRSRCVVADGSVVDGHPDGVVSSREFGHLVPLNLSPGSGARSAHSVVPAPKDNAQLVAGFDAGDFRNRQPGGHVQQNRTVESVLKPN